MYHRFIERQFTTVYYTSLVIFKAYIKLFDYDQWLSIAFVNPLNTHMSLLDPYILSKEVMSGIRLTFVTFMNP